MKKLNTLLILVFGVLLAKAQPQAAPPPYYNNTGVTSNTIPLNFTSNRCQFIYGPNVFNTNGLTGTPLPSGQLITKVYIKFSNTVNPAGVINNFTIAMGQNVGTTNAIPSTTYNAGLTQVYFAPTFAFTGIAAGDWLGVTLQTPFLYDPSLSLVLDLNTTSTSSGNSIGYLTTTGINQRLYGPITSPTGTSGIGLLHLGFDVIPSGPCTDPPTPGVATSSASNVCSGELVNLTLTGNSTGTGQTYQWESATNIGGPYTPIGGLLNNPVLQINPTTSQYYRCQVNCGATTLPSTEVQVTVPALFPGGSYTINSALPTGGSNFQSFTAAVSAISCGIAGPIDFTVSPGTYNEQISLPSTIGSTALNTVTFNCNNSTLSFASADANKRYVVQLNGADYITFNDLIIDGSAGTYGWGLHLTNGADNNSFNLCTINTSTSNTTINNHYPIVINGSNTTALATGISSNNNSFIDMILSGGYNGVILYGNSAAGQEALSNSFTNTQVKEFYQYGFQCLYQKNMLLSGSDITRVTRTSITTTAGVFVSTGCLNSLVENSKVHNLFDAALTNTSACYPLYCTADGTLAEPNRFVNNLVYNINHVGIVYGIYNTGGDNMRAYHNTISLDAPATATAVTYGMYQTTQALGLEYRNNLITIGRGGTAAKVGLYFNTNTSTIVSNNNVVYLDPASGGTNNKHYGNYAAVNFTSLANWQTANGGVFDANSVAANPLYVNAAGGDFTPTAVATNNIGTNVGVGFDINGTTRSLVAPDCGAIEYSLPGLDAGISWVSPTSPTTAGLKTITVSLINNLANPINSLVLTYTDGVTPVSQTFSGLNFTAGTSQTFSFTTQYNLTVNSSLRAYITSVNGISDNNQGNDTTGLQNLCLSLSGAYTINSGAPASATNFQSFTAAAAALVCGGVSGPVSFDVVAGSGPYTQQVQLGAVPGSSSTNTITFNGNNNVLTYNGTGDYYTLRLNGADYTNWNNLTINATGATNGICLMLSNASDNNSFTNCTFNASLTATGTTSTCIAFSASATTATTTGNNGNNNTFTSCTTNGGYYGFSMYGNTTANITSNQILGCTIRDFYFYGIYGIYNGTTIIRDCIIERPTRATVSSGYGIYITTSSANCLIERNRVRNLFGGLVSPTTSAAYGISNFASPTAGNENRIINNVVSDIRNNGIVYGIQNAGSNSQVYHNTIDINHPASTATGVTYGISNSVAAGVDIRNNIVTVNRGGTGNRYCVFYSVLPAVSNNNDLFIVGTGTNYIGYNPTGPVSYTILGAYQSGTGLDAASVSVDPVYVDPVTNNYQPSAVGVNNNGAALGVSLDITGAVRNPTNPDLGAYEFNVFPNDIGVFTFVSPGTGNCYSSTENIIVSLKNYGSNAIDFAIDPATITCIVSGATTATLTASPSGTLASGATMNVTLSPTLDMTANGTYSFNVSSSMGSDGNASNDALNTVTRTVGITAGTVSSNTPDICVSGTPNLTLSGQSGGTRQWQESTVSASGPWTNVGTGGTSYTPAAPVTQTTYYQVESSCNTNTATSNVVTVTVNNPVLLSTTPGSRCGPGSVILGATASGTAVPKWYNAASGGIPIGSGVTFNTPNIASTTNFYVSAAEGGGGVFNTPMPALGTPFSGNVRGFWFTAPSAFTITGLNVPLTGTAQSMAVVKFVPAVGPPAFSAITNDFVTLYLTQNNPNTGVLPVNIPIAAGDVIGILGQMETQSAYAATTGIVNTTINGVSVPLTRMLMQFPLGTTAPQNLSTEVAAAIGVVNITYTTGCEGPRVPVLATINAAPAITASIADPTICPGTSTNISVSSSNANYSYTWASAPVGYTVNGAGPHTVSPTTTTKYYVGAIDSSTGPFAGCTAIDSVSVITAPALLGGTISAPISAYCQSGSPSLTLSGSSGGNIQWQSSTVSASGPWTNVGTGLATYSPGLLTQTTYYQAEVRCSPTTAAYSNVFTVTVNTPQVISGIPGSRCSSGTVTLGVNVSSGSTANWYTSASGGTPIASGITSFTTPSISTSTNYYVAASSGGFTANVGKATLSPGSTQNTGTAAYIIFDALSNFTLQTVNVYPYGAVNAVPGTMTISLANSSGTVLQSAVVNVIAYTTANPTVQTVPLNFNITPGTGYRLLFTAYTGGVTGALRDLTTATPAPVFPYTLPGVVSITNSSIAGYYYYFYNWSVSTGCESPRVPVLATVNMPSSSSSTITAPCSYVWNSNTYTASGTYVVTTVNAAGCDSVQTLNLTLTPCNTTLNLNAFIQGYWDGVSGMVPVLANQFEPTTANACDTITVMLKDELTYATVATTKAVLNQDGTCTATFTGGYTGSYYIALQHRTAVETWSATPVSMAGSPSYNFTTSNAQSYGPNMVEVATGVWAMYSGDCVKDPTESVDLTDIAQIELDNGNFAFGYQVTDITGDGSVDLADFPLVELNVNAFIFSNHP